MKGVARIPIKNVRLVADNALLQVALLKEQNTRILSKNERLRALLQRVLSEASKHLRPRWAEILHADIRAALACPCRHQSHDGFRCSRCMCEGHAVVL